MSLILEYAGGGSPPTADILYSTSSTDPANNTCGLPSPPTQSISSLSSSSAEDCDVLGLLSSSSSQTSSALLNNSSSSGYTSPFVSDEILSPSNHLPCGGSSSASSTSHWHHVRHDRGDLFLPPFSGSPSPGAEEGTLLLDSYMEDGGEVGGDMMTVTSSSSSSSLGNHHHRLAGKASRRRRRSPPSVTKFDINDNSLHSVYAFVKSFLSASTASTVAIDNKIEQAMDLVKSHLMFAVREEVDVLKERIGELMERINHLEYENTVLRKYATQEALQQIQQQQHGGAPNP